MQNNTSPYVTQPVASIFAVQPALPPVQQSSASLPDDGVLSWHDLRTLILPLPAFLTTNSHELLLDPNAVEERFDPHWEQNGRVRLCYRLNRRFFHEDTSLDDPMLALFRLNRRARGTRRSPLYITTELTYNVKRGLYTPWSALVITVSRRAEREACVQHVNRLLRFILRPGYIQPLSEQERAMLGRVAVPNQR